MFSWMGMKYLREKDSTMVWSTSQNTTISKYTNVDTQHISLNTKVITEMDAIAPLLFFKGNSHCYHTCVKWVELNSIRR